MKIHSGILHEILQHTPSAPPETGGILGGKEGRVCLWKYDAGCAEEGCAYRPDVDFLNQVIAGWIDKGYDFMGILHVHFGGSKALSDGDKRYIEEIMRAMPSPIDQLYFPIVVHPQRQLISYIALRNVQNEITITSVCLTQT